MGQKSSSETSESSESDAEMPESPRETATPPQKRRKANVSKSAEKRRRGRMRALDVTQQLPWVDPKLLDDTAETPSVEDLLGYGDEARSVKSVVNTPLVRRVPRSHRRQPAVEPWIRPKEYVASASEHTLVDVYECDSADVDTVAAWNRKGLDVSVADLSRFATVLDDVVFRNALQIDSEAVMRDADALVLPHKCSVPARVMEAARAVPLVLGSGMLVQRRTEPIRSDPSVVRCQICFGDDDAEGFLSCKGHCNMVVHRDCFFGVHVWPAGQPLPSIGPRWMCASCVASVKAVKRKQAAPKCATCLQRGHALWRWRKSDTHDLPSSSKRATWMHPMCAMWFAELAFVRAADTVNMEVHGDIGENRKGVCTSCRSQTGYTLNCCKDGCQTTYHPMCALQLRRKRALEVEPTVTTLADERSIGYVFLGRRLPPHQIFQMSTFCIEHTPLPAPRVGRPRLYNQAGQKASTGRRRGRPSRVELKERARASAGPPRANARAREATRRAIVRNAGLTSVRAINNVPLLAHIPAPVFDHVFCWWLDRRRQLSPDAQRPLLPSLQLLYEGSFLAREPSVLAGSGVAMGFDPTQPATPSEREAAIAAGVAAVGAMDVVTKPTKAFSIPLPKAFRMRLLSKAAAEK